MLCDYRADDSKKVISLYNTIAGVVVEYQFLYHRAWMQAMPSIMSALSVSLLFFLRVLFFSIIAVGRYIGKAGECV